MNADHLEVLRAAHARVYGISWFTVERATRTPDGVGGQTIEWHTVASGHGTFKRSNGSKRSYAERLVENYQMTLTCAYDVNINQGDRVKAKDVTYNVQSVDVDSDELLVRTAILEVL